MNPLLVQSQCIDGAVPFHEIKKEHFIPALDHAIELAKKNIEILKNNLEAPNFLNTILALETSTEWADHVITVFSNLEIANGDDDFHQLAKVLYPKLTNLKSDIALNEQIFIRVKTVFDQQHHWPLSGEQKKLLENTYKGFVRNGALLDEEGKELLRKIDQELSILGPQFSENVLKATNAFEMILDKKEDVAGLPDMVLEAAAHLAEQKGHSGKWLFSLQHPSYLPFITYAKKRSLREKIWRAANSKAFGGEFDNQENIKKMLNLRHERAQLLGFKNHAEFTLMERMALSSENVMNFLGRLNEASRAAAHRELAELKYFAKKLEETSNESEPLDGELRQWDVAFYSEKLKEKQYAFNEEELRPYFKLENVVSGVFEHARLLYGLIFKENHEIPVYHQEMQAYEVFEEGTHKYVGLFYVDLFPRETKKGGAWMTSFRSQGFQFGKQQRPHISIVCNFTRSTPTKPSLLNHDEVRTLFHEFGHALHGLLSECEYSSISGANTLWDFVELPSQIMENWVQHKEGLDLFAQHFETAKPMPLELINKVRASQKFQAGMSCLRQLNFAILDMRWHLVDPKEIENVAQWEEKTTSETRLFPAVEGTNSSCSFSHIFAGGYSAGYYSYKWAEVLEADAFELFIEKGLFNKEVAMRFKENILSRGDSEHPMELYKKFRGREPDPDALLRRDGLVE